MIRRKVTRWTRAALRSFSSTATKLETRDAAGLSDRIIPRYHENGGSDLLSLQWPSPPRNVLMIKKNGAPAVTESMIEYANHIHSNYPNVSLIFEPHVAAQLQNSSPHAPFPFHMYTTNNPSLLSQKVDITTTLGGDGTILHASSLFSKAPHVPPMLSFSMGTLGFLGEWKFAEFKRAFREVYMSGAEAGSRKHPYLQETGKDEGISDITGWSSIRGKSMGPTRSSKVLLRNRLKVGVFDVDGRRVGGDNAKDSAAGDIHAMNEVIIHRGVNPHLTIIEVFVGGRFLTEAVADGIIISTPTGSTAYSLSSGGSIVHPLVSSLLLTPICPRSLSFRPLVLPANALVTLRLSEKNRGRELEVSIDGKRRTTTVGCGMEIRVLGENVEKGNDTWSGGIPCVMRGSKGGLDEDDGWVGGLNGLLKFNYPLGEE